MPRHIVISSLNLSHNFCYSKLNPEHQCLCEKHYLKEQKLVQSNAPISRKMFQPFIDLAHLRESAILQL